MYTTKVRVNGGDLDRLVRGVHKRAEFNSCTLRHAVESFVRESNRSSDKRVTRGLLWA
jgi:hypothetical protein